MAAGLDAVVYDTEEDTTELASGQGADVDAIDRLADEELHQKVLTRIRDRIKFSKRKIEKLYNRWQANEHRFQAYMRSQDLEDLYKKSNERGTPLKDVTITVPYSYATAMTVVTYLIHTFCGRNPMFSVGAYSGEAVIRAQKMETLLQFNADFERLIRKLYQFFIDGEMYGVHILRVTWKVKRARRTRFRDVSPNVLFFPGLLPQNQRVQEEEIVFEGNDIENIDPYRFFPDPRVPMDQVAEKGEFVFWRVFDSRINLKKAEAEGSIKYLDKVQNRNMQDGLENPSARTALSDGEEVPGRDDSGALRSGYYQLDQGTIDIIPSEWGLSESDVPEKWIFTVANDKQIIQAEPLDADHDRHPVVVGEPYSVGYGFGHIAMLDLLGPMQDTLSWLINSHMFNVRAALNNQLVVNPQMVDMADLKKPAPGRVIKLLPSAMGMDPKMAVAQLQVADVTRTHVTDMSVITRMADSIASVNDNLRGIQDSGGRKTATEVRTSGESGASRLAAHARLESAQSIVPLADMMTLNLQQNMSQEFMLSIAGQDTPSTIRPEDIQARFYFPVHDGTLPTDRVALMEVWKEILLAMFQNPVLGQRYDVDGVFQYVAELGGAKNLSQFKLAVAAPNMGPLPGQVPVGAPGRLPLGAA